MGNKTSTTTLSSPKNLLSSEQCEKIKRIHTEQGLGNLQRAQATTNHVFVALARYIGLSVEKFDPNECQLIDLYLRRILSCPVQGQAIQLDSLLAGVETVLHATGVQLQQLNYNAICHGGKQDFDGYFTFCLLLATNESLEKNETVQQALFSGMKRHIKSQNQGFGCKPPIPPNASAPGKELITFAQFKKWHNTQMPSLFSPILSHLQKLIDSTKIANFYLPKVLHQSSMIGKGEVATFALADTVFQKDWNPLFISSVHGRSFETLAGSIIYYPAPTILLITDKLGNVFGGFANGPWKHSTKFFGAENGSTSCLFSLNPGFQIFRSRSVKTSDAQHYQYLNFKTKNHFHGLGMGGSEMHPRLFLDAEFEKCRASRLGLTFEMGDLRENTKENSPDLDGTVDDEEEFEPVSIEIYGFGGPEALEAQRKAKQEEYDMAMNRRKVDKKQFVQSDFDKEFLLGTTFNAVNKKEDR